MSDSWIQAVRSSGRFKRFNWNRSEEAIVTTLDKLIDEFGIPAFCKIDVEGFEEQVIRGLTQCLPALSFESSPELVESTSRIIDYLEEIGHYRFNYSPGESMKMALPEWVAGNAMKRTIGLSSRTSDIYARIF